MVSEKKPASIEKLKIRINELEAECSRLRLAKISFRQNEQKLTQIIQGNSIATFVIDARHVITHWNKACEDLTGFSAQEMLGTHQQWRAFYPDARPVLADLIVDQQPEAIIAKYYGDQYRISILKRGAYEAEGFFPDLGEDGKWLFFSAAPILDDQNNVCGAVETLQDLTHRRQAEKAVRILEDQYRTVLDFVPYPIVVFDLSGEVTYLNPAFSKTFGWTLLSLLGRRIPFVPSGYEQETKTQFKRLLDDKLIVRFETKRLTKSGRLLDVVLKAAVTTDAEGQQNGILLILRDITHEKRLSRMNEAVHRISLALPEHPDLTDLLDYTNNEIKRLLSAEGAAIVLLDEEKNELFIPSAVYDQTDTQNRVKEVRFALDELKAGEVIKSGQTVVISSETSLNSNSERYAERDKKLGYQTRNLVEVPLRSSDRIIGVLAALNKKRGDFDQADVDLLQMIAGTVGLSFENARFSEELKKAYREVSSLNTAKDKAISHLSHELRTPVSVLSGSLKILTKKLDPLPEKNWRPTIERIQRNLDRIVEIQAEVDDIMQLRDPERHQIYSVMLERCVDELETLFVQELGEGPLIDKIKETISEQFGAKVVLNDQIRIDRFVSKRLEFLKPLFSHREITIRTFLNPTPPICIPADPLYKVFDGLLKNAIENTPDEGQIDISTQVHDHQAELIIRDYGIGLSEEAQKRIFDGFYSVGDVMDYSTKRPYDFGAGGRGADLLRMKIFSERYHFKIELTSERCRFLPHDQDKCPGRIGNCPHCKDQAGCHQSGGTVFRLQFALLNECPLENRP
jgi:PAS domain S-box-containing protein